MRAVAPFAALLALALAAPLALAADAPKGLWDGCKEGSWVLERSTSKTTIPGAPEMQERVSEMRTVLIKVTDDEWTVRSEVKAGDDEWLMGTDEKLPRKAAATGLEGKDAPKPEDLGTEKVTVEGKDYACKKTRTVVGDTTTTSWVSDEQGLLKSESKTGEGATGTTSTSEVTALAKKAKVGDKEVACRETKSSGKSSAGESTMVMLMSDAVPGHVVRMEMTSAVGPTKSHSVTEAIAFEIR